MVQALGEGAIVPTLVRNSTYTLGKPEITVTGEIYLHPVKSFTVYKAVGISKITSDYCAQLELLRSKIAETTAALAAIDVKVELGGVWGDLIPTVNQTDADDAMNCTIQWSVNVVANQLGFLVQISEMVKESFVTEDDDEMDVDSPENMESPEDIDSMDNSGLETGLDSEMDADLDANEVPDMEDELDISRGDMLVRPGNMPEIGNEFEASICWMSEQAMEIGRGYFIKHCTKTVRAYVEKLHHKVNIDDLHREKADKLSTELTSSLDGKSLEVQTAALDIIKQTFKSVGLSLEDSAQVIKDGHNATLTVLDKYGEEHTMPDTSNRLKAAMLHLELQGLLKTKDKGGDTTNVYALQVNQILEQLKVKPPLASKTVVVSPRLT